MKNRLVKSMLIFIVVPFALIAQNKPVAILEYFEDPETDMVVTDEIGKALRSFDMGEILPPGFSIKTGSGFAEIRLEPNGTMIKLSENTDFSITILQGYRGSPSNEFSLIKGKIRTIAARTSGINYYNVRTPTAVMGVRGTDFINEISGTVSRVVVREGLVEVIPFKGSPVMVSKNQFVDTSTANLQAQSMSQEQINALFSSMYFLALSPSDVPGHAPLPPGENRLERSEIISSKEETLSPESPSPEQPIDESPVLSQAQPEKPKNIRKKEGFPHVLFGMEIGTTMIDGKNYSKLILQPTILSGKFRMALNLPVIYLENLFESHDYYRPAGNNEWSFGTDQNSEAKDILLDILRDTMLKIKFVEYGDRQRDPFFLKVGNLHNLSIGHGTIMKDYGNDSEYPSIRKVGFNMGFDLGRFGVEFVGDNLAEPSIVGSRVFVNPFGFYKAFQIGVTGITDLFPARKSSDPSAFGDPWLIGLGVDMQFVKVNREKFKLSFFGDFSSMIPIFREETNLGNFMISPGIAPGPWINKSTLENYGIVTGFRGSISQFNWALEYRLSTGVYRPATFDMLYERNKEEYLSEIIYYIENPDGANTRMGIYGEAGFSIKNKLTFSLGYYIPWEVDNSISEMINDDKINLSLEFHKGLIPNFPLFGRIIYERTQFADSIKSGSGLTLINTHTFVYGELAYAVSENVDIAAGASTAIQTDSEGNKIMKADGITPQMAPAINIETRISF